MVSKSTTGQLAWCGCGENLLPYGREKCNTCDFEERGVLDLDRMPIETDARCLVPSCGSRRFVPQKRTPRLLIMECEKCEFEIRLDKKFKISRGSPNPLYARCRRCDSEVVRGKNRNKYWDCNCCSYKTSQYQSKFRCISPETRSFHDPPLGRVRIGRMSRARNPGSLNFSRFRTREWNKIPQHRRDEIISGSELSESYEEALKPFLISEGRYSAEEVKKMLDDEWADFVEDFELVMSRFDRDARASDTLRMFLSMADALPYPYRGSSIDDLLEISTLLGIELNSEKLYLHSFSSDYDWQQMLKGIL